ncbi:hypothetical protein V8C43DRAFT_92991 [Trichoderma afarasin]
MLSGFGWRSWGSGVSGSAGRGPISFSPVSSLSSLQDVNSDMCSSPNSRRGNTLNSTSHVRRDTPDKTVFTAIFRACCFHITTPHEAPTSLIPCRDTTTNQDTRSIKSSTPARLSVTAKRSKLHEPTPPKRSRPFHSHQHTHAHRCAPPFPFPPSPKKKAYRPNPQKTTSWAEIQISQQGEQNIPAPFSIPWPFSVLCAPCRSPLEPLYFVVISLLR